jgi:catechol 2,3-dioxygenase-like lactoylglutathione lyase family enzyme
VFDHLEIHVSDLAASRAFYTEALGLPTNDGQWIEWGDFGITPVDDEHPLSRNLHVGFGVPDRDAVEAWWTRMTGAGYESDGEPGPRPEYSAAYYGAFVRDPDGHSIEAVCHETTNVGAVDHVWFRTRDVAGVRRFMEAVAPAVGITLRHDTPDRVQYSDGTGSFSFVAGEPTQNVHYAFGVPDVDAVRRFHEAATAAGYRSNGEPGERPEYHPGYHGAFVFDPDGHNAEAVFHDRR